MYHTDRPETNSAIQMSSLQVLVGMAWSRRATEALDAMPRRLVLNSSSAPALRQDFAKVLFERKTFQLLGLRSWSQGFGDLKSTTPYLLLIPLPQIQHMLALHAFMNRRSYLVYHACESTSAVEFKA